MVVSVTPGPKETNAQRILRVLSDGHKRTAFEICREIYDTDRLSLLGRVDTIQATASKMVRAGQLKTEKRHKMTVYFVQRDHDARPA